MCGCGVLMLPGTANAVRKFTFAYSAMFAILGFGYNRFFYAGTQDQWDANVKFALLDFFSSEV
jgi:hypothetical protein